MKKILSSLCMVSVSLLFFSCQKSDLSDLAIDNESNSNLSIGQEYQGGIIFYLDETKKHGLIAAKEDLGPAAWGCYGTSIPGAQSMEDGFTNTKAILANCNEPGIAARLCDEYVVKEKGANGKIYDDWFLPSFYQLLHIGVGANGAYGICSKQYMVSTEAYGAFYGILINEANSTWAPGISCSNNNTVISNINYTTRPKTISALVRPIRGF